MKRTKALDDLMTALQAVVIWLDESRTPYAVVGGFAVGLLAEPRHTEDIDIVADISADKLEMILQQVRGFGLTPAHPDSIDIAKRLRMLRLHHKKLRKGIDIFLASTQLEHEIIRSGTPRQASDFKYNVVSPEYLIIMKVISGRSRDLIDCGEIIKRQAKLDWDLIEKVVVEWGENMERAGCVETLETVRKNSRRGNE